MWEGEGLEKRWSRNGGGINVGGRMDGEEMEEE